MFDDGDAFLLSDNGIGDSQVLRVDGHYSGIESCGVPSGSGAGGSQVLVMGSHSSGIESGNADITDAVVATGSGDVGVCKPCMISNSQVRDRQQPRVNLFLPVQNAADFQKLDSKSAGAVLRRRQLKEAKVTRPAKKAKAKPPIVPSSFYQGLNQVAENPAFSTSEVLQRYG